MTTPDNKSLAMGPGTPLPGRWAILRGRWGYEAVEIATVTPKLIKHKSRFGRRMMQSARDCIVALLDDEGAAKQLVQSIDGARDRFRKQRGHENQRHDAEMAAIAEKQDRAVQRVIDAALATARGEQSA